jgi:prevent-host-death family protein
VEPFESSNSSDLSESNDLITINAMQTMTANAAKTNFGLLLDTVQREPVRVTRHDRVVGVMVSAQDYEAMRQFYANRVLETMDRIANSAAAAGLTEEKLAELLADES